MAEDLGRAELELTTDQRPLDRGLDRAEARSRSFVARTQATLAKVGTQLRQTGQSLSVAVTVPIIAAGAAIFKVGKNFDRELNQIVGLVGIAREQVNAWKPEIESLAVATGIGPVALAKALYFVASSGIEASKVLDVVAISARASAAGMGDVEKITDGLTSVMAAYSKSNLSAADAMNIWVRMVQVGKAEASDLAEVVGSIAPAASQLDVSFEDLMGTMAVLSRVNSDVFENATSLVQIFNTLLSPTRETEKALAGVGLSSAMLRKELGERGTIAMLQLLAGTVGDNDEAIAAVFPNIRALRGVLNVLSQDAGGTADALAAVADHTGALGSAFDAVASSPGFKFDQAMAKLQVQLIKLADDVMPVVAEVVTEASEAVAGFVRWWQKLDPETRKSLVSLALIVAVVGPVLIVLGSLASAAASVIGLFRGIAGAAGIARTGIAGILGVSTLAATALAGIATAAVAAVAFAYVNIRSELDKQAAALTEKTTAWVTTATLEQLQAAREGIAKELQRLIFTDMADVTGQQATVRAQLDIIDAAIRDKVIGTARGVRDEWWKNMAPIPGDTARVLVEGSGAVQTAAQGMAGVIPTALGEAKEEVVKSAAEIAEALVDGIRDKRSDWQRAWDQLKDDLKNQMPPIEELSTQLGILASKSLRKGLRSEDPQVKAQAEYTQQLMLDALHDASEETLQGVLASKAMQQGLASQNPEVRKKWKKIKAIAIEELENLAERTGGWGKRAILNYAKGLADKHALARVRDAVQQTSTIAARYLEIKSPAKEGPLSRGGGPEGWGARLTTSTAAGMRRPLDRVAAAAADLAAAMVPKTTGPSIGERLGRLATRTAGDVARLVAPMQPVLAGVGAAGDRAGRMPEQPGKGGTRENHYHIHGEGPLRVPDPLAAAQVLRRFAENDALPGLEDDDDA